MQIEDLIELLKNQTDCQFIVPNLFVDNKPYQIKSCELASMLLTAYDVIKNTTKENEEIEVIKADKKESKKVSKA